MSDPAPRPHVAFVNRSYWPDAEATGQLLAELCEDLSEEFRVTVLCGLPNKDLDGAAGALAARERGGVAIRRVGHTRFPKRSGLGRICNWLTFAAHALWSGLWMKRPDVLIVETDPPFLCLVGRLLAWRHRCRLVVYLQDIYPDIAVALGALREGLFTKTLRRLFRASYRSADRVVVLSADMRRLLVESGIPAGRVETVPNWVDTALVKPPVGPNGFRAEHGLDGKFVVMYSGNLGRTQQLDKVVEAARLLQDEPGIRFLFVGDGAMRGELEAAAADLPNVKFLGYQTKQRLGESLSAANLQLIPLHPSVTPYMMPSKLYGVLASGVPALVAAPLDSELAEVVRSAPCGFVVSPDDARGLAWAIQNAATRPEMLEQMGRIGRRLAEERYDRAVCTARFAELLRGMLPELAAPVPRATAKVGA